MKLPFSLSFGKKQVKNYFLALLLQDETVGAVVFEEEAGQLHVVGNAQASFSTSLEDASFDELLELVDKVISRAEEALPQNTQTEKTVFGVKSSWIEEGKIKREYLLKLKKVCDELSLSPIGFLVFIEAILHLLQKEEGAPVSSIFVENGKKFLTVSIVRAGRIVESKQIPFDDDLPSAVDSALRHFTNIEIFPARVILFDSEDNNRLAQAFIHHSWSKTLPFLHVPQITILPSNFDTKAVLYGTATQMGFVVDERQVIIPTKTQIGLSTNLEEEPIQTAVHMEEEPGEEISQEEKNVTDKQEITQTVDADYFGFLENKDVAKTALQPTHALEQEDFPSSEKLPEEEIEQIPEQVKERITDAGQRGGGLPLQGVLMTEGMQKVFRMLPLKYIQQSFLHFNKIFKKQLQRTVQPGLRTKKTKSKLIFLIPGVIILSILLVVWYIIGVKATVTIFISPKTVSEKQTITFITDGTNDFSHNLLAIDTPTVSEDGSVSTTPTGTKEVGTPAKGAITIFSRLDTTTNLPKGTTISGNGNDFTLDNSVTIASFSGDVSDPAVEVNNVAVTAKDIGTQANLPSGTKFSIDGLSTSDVSGKNDSAFSGGTKNDITVVAQKDLDGLATTLTQNLESKAKDDLGKTADGTKQLLPFFLNEQVTKKTFSKNVGDQTTSVSLDGTISYQGAVLDKSELLSFAQTILKDQITNSQTIAINGIQTNVGDIKKNDNSYTASIDLSAALLPKIDLVDNAKAISGKSFDQASTLIKSLPQVSDVTISIHPSLPFLPKVLPRLSQNITLVMQTNE